MLALLQSLATSPRATPFWAAGTWLADAALTLLIIRKVPFTNVDWETYIAQVDAVLGGQFDYSQIQGPTGPIAYPAGFCWTYALLRWSGLEIGDVQIVFFAIYLGTIAVVFRVYQRAGAPGWLLPLCILSKRVHSVYVLRLFNDAVAQLFAAMALLLLLQRRHTLSSVTYSFAVSVKMHPLLYCPAVGLALVLSGGWSHALQQMLLMMMTQLLLAVPFLRANPWTYFSRAFGGPGDLQQVWSVSWKFLPEGVFYARAFTGGLLLCNLAFLAWFAHARWVPGGLLGKRAWAWSSEGKVDGRALVCVCFACNFVNVAFLRTIHFQFLAWYFHSVPFLAWYAVQPERHEGLAWAGRCVLVALLTLAVEVPYLLTTRGISRGPDGRLWETDGVPTVAGSVLLQGTHAALLALLARRRVQLLAEEKAE